MRRFVGVAGVLRGLHSCLATGPANAAYSSCWSQEIVDSESFGVYPAGDPLAVWLAPNPRMAPGGYRDVPRGQSATTFFTIGAGDSDEVLCSLGHGCDTFVFDPAANVAAQIDVGLGHLRARSDTADLQVKMLTTGCTGEGCCEGHTGVCVDAEREQL